MRQNAHGYTIVEVLIVLSVSAFMLTGAALLLKGQNSETTFNQSLRDVASKLQNTISGVGNSLFTNAGSYSCSLVAGSDGVKRATLASGGNGIGTNEQCLYLGKAFEVIKGQGQIYTYTVLGGRTYDSGGQTYTATTFSQSHPEPQIASGFDLTSSFTPSAGGLYLLSAHYDGSANTETDLAGFYNDLAGSNASREQLLGKAYAFTANASNPKLNVQNCLEEQASCSNFTLNDWKLCYQNSAKNRTALIEVQPGATGVNVKITDTACS